MSYSITECEEEAFFDRYFDCGNDEVTAENNARISLQVLKGAYESVKKVSELAENGECFDAAEAKLSFQQLALAKKFLYQFLDMCATDVKEQLLKEMAELF